MISRFNGRFALPHPEGSIGAGSFQAQAGEGVEGINRQLFQMKI